MTRPFLYEMDQNTLQNYETHLRNAFPDLQEIEPLSFVAEGFHSIVVETAGSLIFRIAKNAEAARGHNREIKALPKIAKALSVEVPTPEWHLVSGPGFPFGLIGYRKLPGVHATPASFSEWEINKLAHSIAECLTQLHNCGGNHDIVQAAPPFVPYSERLLALRSHVFPALERHLSPTEMAMIEDWQGNRLSDVDGWDISPALCHGDLWYENFLVNEGSRVSGLLDFEGLRLDDPAIDLCTNLYLGDEFAAEVVRWYLDQRSLGSDFLERFWLCWELRELEGIRFSLAHDDEAELLDSIGKLRQSPILLPAKWEPAEARLRNALDP